MTDYLTITKEKYSNMANMRSMLKMCVESQLMRLDGNLIWAKNHNGIITQLVYEGAEGIYKGNQEKATRKHTVLVSVATNIVDTIIQYRNQKYDV